MKVIVSVGFVATIACSASNASDGGPGGTSSKVYCQKNTASGACRCEYTDPGPEADYEYVDSCDVVPSGSICCYDVNGDGETTSCSCVVPQCVADTDTNYCWCRYFAAFIVGNNRDNEQKVTSCSNGCCQKADSCDCFGSIAPTACSGTIVSACAPPTTYSCGSGKKATSCRGLTWKAR